ncbi:uncharacterized protein LOC126834908 [Adelges cooleyi]|uniref:uncharacterized protein LOC126834908 n=1 Tax=Adelges cooleyi TaxID=133065 RepID=UPI00217FD4D3|nr:uncharacterized protein LOC126834908 [Adelges cooleyi]
MHYKLFMSIAILYGVWYMGQADTLRDMLARKLCSVVANSGWQLLKSMRIIENQGLLSLGQFALTITPTLAEPEVYAAYCKLGRFLACKYSNMTRVFIRLSMKMTNECRNASDVNTLGDCVKLVIMKLKDIDNKVISRMSAALVTLCTTNQVQSVVKMLGTVHNKVSEIGNLGRRLFGFTSSSSKENNLKDQLNTIESKLSKVDDTFLNFMEEHCFVERITGETAHLDMTDEIDLVNLYEGTTENLLPILSNLIDTLTDSVIEKLHNRLGFRFNEVTKTSVLVDPENRIKDGPS